uniref:Uncharacterized protein n=1 Tax=Myotis myotis TaxID=51298 RepID=A0A7J7UQ24_MYOMY|nr:hypothetical protein mMyoMyo1_008628 [Myotis myotis]
MAAPTRTGVAQPPPPRPSLELLSRRKSLGRGPGWMSDPRGSEQVTAAELPNPDHRHSLFNSELEAFPLGNSQWFPVLHSQVSLGVPSAPMAVSCIHICYNCSTTVNNSLPFPLPKINKHIIWWRLKIVIIYFKNKADGFE